MRSGHDKVRRILAVDPVSRGFGFVVVEGRDRLVDWGTREARIDKEKTCLNKIAALWERYEPDVLVLEECAARGCRRSTRVRGLLRRLRMAAVRRGLRVRAIPRRAVRKAFASRDARTKDQIARAIAAEFPEIAPYLPPLRKPWMTEDQRMSVFVAVAIAVVVLGKRIENSGERPTSLKVQRHREMSERK
ncbi:MAG: hypothetical protein HYS14_11090 [Candidatus Rokubacteria bacterium]|nr:hypothetical protein [Candidatus Rokubacteria bacterium]